MYDDAQSFRCSIEVYVLCDQARVDAGNGFVPAAHFVVIGGEDDDPVAVLGEVLRTYLAAVVTLGDQFERMFFGIV